MARPGKAGAGFPVGPSSLLPAITPLSAAPAVTIPPRAKAGVNSVRAKPATKPATKRVPAKGKPRSGKPAKKRVTKRDPFKLPSQTKAQQKANPWNLPEAPSPVPRGTGPVILGGISPGGPMLGGNTQSQSTPGGYPR